MDPPRNLSGIDSGEDGPDSSIYTDGEYLSHNPTWHAEDAVWKSKYILQTIDRNKLTPRSVCEVGCGTGEILVQLQQNLPDETEFLGYDISPQAYALAAPREDQRLNFRLGDVTEQRDAHFDLILAIDLLEHVEDYYGFLRKLQPLSEHKIFHFPLDLSAYTVLRSHPIIEMREEVGHIHYFTCDTALAALRDTGYEPIDWFYPPNDDPLRGRPFRQKALALLRNGLGKLSQDFAVRLLGGRSLMVLAR